MKKISDVFMNNIRQFGMLFALVALTGFFQIRTDGLVLTSANMINLLNGNAYILVLAIGMALVIIAGHIDLSVGSVASFAGVVTALAMRDWGLSPTQGVLLCLAVGAAIGAWQGFWVAYVGIPAFVATLAGMMLFRGGNQLIGKSNTIPVPEGIQYLGGGYLPAIGPDTGFNNLTLLLGAASILWLLLSTLLTRRATLRHGGEPAPWNWTIARLALLSGVIAFLTYLFASGRPRHFLSCARPYPARPDPVLRLHHQTYGHRPPHLRGGRCAARGAAFRRQFEAGCLSGDAEHVRTRRPGRPDVYRPRHSIRPL